MREMLIIGIQPGDFFAHFACCEIIEKLMMVSLNDQQIRLVSDDYKLLTITSLCEI